MAENPELHARLIARQPDEELNRKACKAWMRRGKLWTQEEMDAADRKAMRWHDILHKRHEQGQPYMTAETDIAKATDTATRIVTMASDALHPLDQVIGRWPAEFRAIIWDAVADMASRRAREARRS